MGFGIGHGTGNIVYDFHDRPVGRILEVIAVRGAEGETVQLGSGDRVGRSEYKRAGNGGDGGLPARLVGSGRSVKLHIGRVVGVHDLPVGQIKHVVLIRSSVDRVRRSSNLGEGGAIPLENTGRRTESAAVGAACDNDVAIGLKRGRSIIRRIGDGEVRARSPG